MKINFPLSSSSSSLTFLLWGLTTFFASLSFAQQQRDQGQFCLPTATHIFGERHVNTGLEAGPGANVIGLVHQLELALDKVELDHVRTAIVYPRESFCDPHGVAIVFRTKRDNIKETSKKDVGKLLRAVFRNPPCLNDCPSGVGGPGNLQVFEFPTSFAVVPDTNDKDAELKVPFTQQYRDIVNRRLGRHCSSEPGVISTLIAALRLTPLNGPVRTGRGGGSMSMGSGKMMGMSMGGNNKMMGMSMGGNNKMMGMSMGGNNKMMGMSMGGNNKMMNMPMGGGNNKMMGMHMGGPPMGMSMGGNNKMMNMSMGGNNKMMGMSMGGNNKMMGMAMGGNNKMMNMPMGGGNNKMMNMSMGSNNKMMGMSMGGGNRMMNMSQKGGGKMMGGMMS